MVKLHALASAPVAIAFWLGVAGERARQAGARILMLHGIPRRHALLLERIVRYVARHFEVVPLAEIAREASRGAPVARKLALSFDDGLRNNVEIAYPILRKHGVPATFFVCPGLVERGAWLWNHEARQRLKRLALGARSEIAAELGCDGEVESLIYRMKRLPLAQREAAEERIREATPGFSPTPEERHEFDVASWKELRSLDPQLVAIGSHTLTHPILPTLAPAQAQAEIAESRRLLERKLAREVELFAYPNGDISASTLAFVRSSYRAAVTVETGWVASPRDPFLLPRINVPGSVLRLVLALHRNPQPEPPAWPSVSPA